MVVQQKMVLHTNIEKAVMQELSHPFIVKLYYSAQTDERLYLAMEYLEGGTLFDILSKNNGPLAEKSVRFYGAQIVLALGELHKKNFIYRDLKLENIMLDAQGNVRLTDFGLSHRDPTGEGVDSFSGTPIYLAPEIFLKGKHGKSIDFWCLGIALFMLLCFEPPFWKENHRDLFEEIKTAEPCWKYQTHLSDAASDLLHGLLEKDVTKRLGMNGIDELKNHAFFEGIDWNIVYKLNYATPFTPTISQKNTVHIRKDDLNDTFEKVDSVSETLFESFSFVAANM